MFSSIFGSSRRKTSSDEHLDRPPIPGARADDGFVVVPAATGPSPGGSGNLYPSFSPGAPPPFSPARPAPQPPFHYLNGVPFHLSKELQMCSNKDAFATQIGDLLAFTAGRMQLDDYRYDFDLEKSVLQEWHASTAS